MTSPTIISAETIGAEIYEIGRMIYRTLRGSQGIRLAHTVRTVGSMRRQRMTKLAWEARREAALVADMAA